MSEREIDIDLFSRLRSISIDQHDLRLQCNDRLGSRNRERHTRLRTSQSSDHIDKLLDAWPVILDYDDQQQSEPDGDGPHRASGFSGGAKGDGFEDGWAGGWECGSYRSWLCDAGAVRGRASLYSAYRPLAARFSA